MRREVQTFSVPICIFSNSLYVIRCCMMNLIGSSSLGFLGHIFQIVLSFRIIL